MKTTAAIYQGDCLEVLKTLPDESVQCCVTSPPYYALRDYGVDGQIGLEPSLAEWVDKIATVFDEVRRVLKPDGVLWMNLGDAYARRMTGTGGGNRTRKGKENYSAFPLSRFDHGLKNKDLMGQPWRVAFELQRRGWYLRADIIWHKPNPMPESTKDRPTKSHEYLFLMTKSEKYYYDGDAIKEDTTSPPEVRNKSEEKYGVGLALPNRKAGHTRFWGSEKRNKRSVWTVAPEPLAESHFAVYPTKLVEPCILAGSRQGDMVLDPFNGSGTTGIVAARLFRNYVGIELNPEYVEITQRRFADEMPLFNNVEVN